MRGDTTPTPEQVVAELKKNGSFDRLRRSLLGNFMASADGVAFTERLRTLLSSMVQEDPRLLDNKDNSRNAFRLSRMLERSEELHMLPDLLQSLLQDPKSPLYQQLHSQILTFYPSLAMEVPSPSPDSQPSPTEQSPSAE